MKIRALLVVVAVTLVCVAASGQSSSIINACVASNGSIRIVSSGACRANETATSWNQQGPSGPAGADGAPGATGPEGPAGPAGPEGTVVPVVYATAGDLSANIPTGQTPYARLVLPRGRYSVSATATVAAMDGTLVECRLNDELNGASSLRARGYVYAPAASSQTTNIPLIMDSTFPVDGFNVTCSSSSPANSVMVYAWLRAIPVGSVQYQFGNLASTPTASATPSLPLPAHRPR